MREHPKRYNILFKKFLTRDEKAQVPKVEPRLLHQLVPSPDMDLERDGLNMDSVTIIIQSSDEAKENKKPARELISDAKPEKEAAAKRKLDEESEPIKRANVEPIAATAADLICMLNLPISHV